MKIKDITLIPPESFVILRVPDINKFLQSSESTEIHDHFVENGIGAIFLDESVNIEVLTDEHLARSGLRRVRH